MIVGILHSNRVHNIYLPKNKPPSEAFTEYNSIEIHHKGMRCLAMAEESNTRGLNVRHIEKKEEK